MWPLKSAYSLSGACRKRMVRTLAPRPAKSLRIDKYQPNWDLGLSGGSNESPDAEMLLSSDEDKTIGGFI